MSINNNRSEQSNYDLWDDNHSEPREESESQVPLSATAEARLTLGEEAQHLFEDQGIIPSNIKNKLDLMALSLFHRIEQVDKEILADSKFKDNKGIFLGYDHPEVKKTVYSSFGITLRDPKHQADSGKFFSKVKSSLSPDILHKSHKAYIGKEVLSLLQMHANMNHTVGLIGALGSLEIGEGILNQLTSSVKLGLLTPIASFATNLAIFKIIVDKNDDFLESEDVSLKAGFTKKMTSLALIWGMRSALIGATAFAGFIHLEKLDLQRFSDRAAQTILEDMSTKAEEDEQNLKNLTRLNTLKSIKIPTAIETSEIQSIESELKKKPASTEVLKIAQDRNITPNQIAILKERSRALFHQVGSMEKDKNETRAEQTRVEKAKVDEQINTATNATSTTPTSTTKYNEARTERLTMNSGEFVNKYVKYIVNKEKEGTFRQLVLENEPHNLSLSNKFQIGVDRLAYEYSHNKTLSLIVNSMGLMFIESFSIITMIIVLRNKKYQQLYSNNEFQSKYSDLITQLSSLVNEHAIKASTLSGVSVTETRLVYQSIIDELIVDLGKLGNNKSLNTTGLTDWYVKQLEVKSRSKSFQSVFSKND
jgi:hypothetical protein